MEWWLSPRWHIQDDPQPLLTGPDDARIILSREQYEAIRGGRLRLASLASSDLFPEILSWTKKLIASRVLVPEYLATGRSAKTEAKDFYLEIFEVICRRLSCSDIWPKVRDGMLFWSGPLLRQPLEAPEDYFPSRPSLCVDLVGNSRRGVRVALDCRDPLCTPWENIQFARRTFERRIEHRADLFHRICELVFKDPLRFANPRVKYLHPAIDYLHDGEEISAYWNLGRADTGQELWNRSLEILDAVGGGVERQLRFKDAFGAFSQPELVGHTFDPGKPPVLKTYVMFDGLNPEVLRDILRVENVLPHGAPVMEALRRIEGSGLRPGGNLGIASLYHPLDTGAKPGIKIHLNLRDGFERKFTMEEITGVVGELVNRAGVTAAPLPETLSLGDGRPVEIVPYTLSFMLVPGAGLTKVTLYVNF